MSWIKRNIEPGVADYLFNIRINLPNRTLFQRNVRPDLVIDFEDLERQLQELPEMLCFFDSLLAEQRAKVATLEAKKEAIKGDLTDEILDRSKREGVKFSVQAIKDITQADDRMMQTQAEIIKETKIEHRLRAVVSALQRKSEHLRSLAGFKREEKRQP
jgi:hypothetical protein